jgi:hypothetical protein
MCAVGVLGGACALAVLAADPLHTGAAPDWPQVSAEAAKALSEYRGGVSNVGRLLVWPGAEEKTFTPDQIPEKIREGAAQWIAKVLKEGYVESGLAPKMIGVRRTRPSGTEADEIFVRYRKGDVVVQVCEHTVGMAILISPTVPSSKGPEDWQGAMRFATQVFSRIFREPALPLKYVSVTTSLGKQEGKNRIFYGRLSLNPNDEFDPKAPRYWFDGITFLVDGDKVAFLFFKTDGEVEKETPKPPPPSGKRW